jgi:hypothetical protein
VKDPHVGFDQYHEPADELPAETRTLRPPLRVGDRGGRGDRLVRAAPPRDLSIDYLSHHADSIELYPEESFSFRAVTPEAAVGLTP